ncbi:very short patch repair endonuclease [Caulobacter sp. 73W]|uniref:Very short patch repair endonuclease n=1 Tax=Caulobacter sp. 73W TaxID=3161137 RepID=A0AB39KS79_9CAUL
MADNRTPQSRSALMARIGAKNTAPELIVRRLLHRLGFRFRLHRKDLPGKPDIVLAKHRTAIFVHGCFWHRHGCKIGRPPKTRAEFWLPKLERNRARDAQNEAALVAKGWNVLTLWQCEIRDAGGLEQRLIQALVGPAPKNPIDSTEAER